ncbi:hypothetical protein, partial [Serratia marcescens]
MAKNINGHRDILLCNVHYPDNHKIRMAYAQQKYNLHSKRKNMRNQMPKHNFNRESADKHRQGCQRSITIISIPSNKKINRYLI